MISAQLTQLYEQLDQQGTKFYLSDDESVDYFGEDNGEGNGMPFSTMTMIYEENAGFPY